MYVSKLTPGNGISASLLFKWRQQLRQRKLPLPSADLPQLLPVALDAYSLLQAMQPELSEDNRFY